MHIAVFFVYYIGTIKIDDNDAGKSIHKFNTSWKLLLRICLLRWCLLSFSDM